MNLPLFPADLGADVVPGSNKDRFKKAGGAYIKAVVQALQRSCSPLGTVKPTVRFNPGGTAVAGDTYATFAIPGADKQILVLIGQTGVDTQRPDHVSICYRIETTGKPRSTGPNNWACGSTDSDDFAERLIRLSQSAL